MNTSKSFALASEVRTATAATTRVLVQRQTMDWNLCFVCSIDGPKPVQLTKPSERKGKARRYLSYTCLLQAFPYLPSATTATSNKLPNASIMP